jgi:hypothetical protein
MGEGGDEGAGLGGRELRAKEWTRTGQKASRHTEVKDRKGEERLGRFYGTVT